MKKQKNLLPDTNAVLFGERKRIHSSSLSWFMRSSVNIAALLIFAVLDFSTVYNLFDNAMPATGWSIAMVTAGICLAENFIPNVSARLMHNVLLIRSRRKANIAFLAISLAVVVILLSFLGYMRWETRNTEISNETSTLDLPDEPSGDISEEETAESGGKDSVALVLVVVPWVTSSLSFFLGFVTDDPARGHYHRVELSRLNAQGHQAELEATLIEARELDPARLEELIHQEYAAACETARCVIQEWLAQWELMLIAHMGSAESAEILAQLYEQIELVPNGSAPVQLYSSSNQRDNTNTAA